MSPRFFRRWFESALTSVPTARAKTRRKSTAHRRHRLEQLEARLLLVGDIQTNVLHPMDVNGDGQVEPLDALLVLNQISLRRLAVQDPGAIDLSQFRNYSADVNCSGTETPLDALLIVNSLARGGLPPGWQFSTTGESAAAGGYEPVGCLPRMIEGDSFVTELTSTFALPNDASAIELVVESPRFASTSGERIRDAFEISVLDEHGQTIVVPMVTGRDAALSWSSGFGPAIAPGVTWESFETGHLVTINLAGREAGREVTLVARLVNNDGTSQSSIVLGRPTIVAAESPRLTSAVPTSTSSRPDGAIDFLSLEDVSSSLRPYFGQTSFHDSRNDLHTELIIQNLGNLTTVGPVVAVLDRLSDPSVAVLDPDGRLDDGRPYFVFYPTGSDGSLAPDRSTTSRTLRFHNPRGERFDFQVTTLARPNRQPDPFHTVPLTEIEANRQYRYRAATTDAEGQSLAYTIITGPAGMAIDPTSGQVSWPTTSEDVGRHDVTLRATDSQGLFVEQAFTIDVVATLQNRPPIFVSTPDTTAIAAGTFDVVTLPTGNLPAGLAVGNFGTALNQNRLSLVSIDQGTQTISLIPGMGPEKYGDTRTIGVGEPPAVGAVLRASLDIDIGLRPHENPFYDSNRVLGLVHGDFDGDGNLDVATSVVDSYRLLSGTAVYERYIAINRGRGDGTFHEATRVAIPGVTTFTFESVGLVSMHARDFDGDGRIDLLALDTKTNALLFYRGRGDGSFEPATVQLTSTNLLTFKTYDIDRDGHLDLVAMRANSSAFGIMRGRGDGSFEDYVEFTTHAGVTIRNNFAIGDLNGDGLLDFVSGNHSTVRLNVYLGNGDGTFNRGVDLISRAAFGANESSINWSTSLSIADFDGDGDADIVYTTISNGGFGLGFGGGLAIYRGDGSGEHFSYAVASDLPTIAAPGNLLGNADPIDLNRDGYLDLVFGGPSDWGNRAPGVLVAINRGDGTFSTQFWIDSGLGSHPRPNNNSLALGALVGDFNRDGMFDLLTARSGDAFQTNQFASVSLMLADTPTTFRAPYDTRLRGVAHGSVQFVESADFNNDGILDLWGPAYQNASFTQLGNGDGTFQDPITATPYIGNEGLGPGFVADLDRDGNLDVVWYGAGGIQGGPQGRYLAALGNGDGTFRITYAQTGNNTSSGYAPTVMEPADFDGDGAIDFAAITGLGTIEIMRNVPEVPGTFVRSYSVPLNAAALTPALSAADYDGDGVADLVAVRTLSSQEHELQFYRGLGNGTLADPISVRIVAGSAFQFPKWISSGDLNGDGALDLVINAAYHRAVVLLGNGDGSFRSPTVYEVTTFNGWERPRLADLNGDGHLDLISVNDLHGGPRSIEVRLGLGDGTFGDRQWFGTSEGAGQLVVGDFDLDGRLDLGINGRSRQDALATFIGAREGLTGITTTDINLDGHADIVAINHDNSHVKRLLGDGRGGFERLPDLLVGAGPVDLLSRDLNADGQADLITVNRSGRSVSVMLAAAGGSYSRQDISVGRLPVAAQLADVDGDGSDDLLVIDAGLQVLFVLTGSGDGTFDETGLIPLGDRPGALAIADVDGDGVVDVIITLPESERLMILAGDGSGGFDAPVYISQPSMPGKLAVADLNGDGRVDLAVTLPDADEVAILFGLGDRRFTQPQRIRVGSRPASIVVADANGDGLSDILVTNAGDDTASVILNRFDPNRVYRYPVAAIDPDDDPVAYEILQGPGGMILDPQGEILWAPTADQIGLNRVIIEASDRRGGVSTQEFVIAVEGERTNAPPVITTLPSSTVPANEAFRYAASSTDPDADRLRYRLLSGPGDATVDPISGEVAWDPRDVGLTFNRQFETGYLEISHQASQNVDSLTWEGWFRFQSTQNQGLVYKALNHASPAYYGLRYQFGQLQAMIGDGTGPGQAVLSVPFTPALNDWTHLAMTFDAATGELAILRNGTKIGSLLTNKRIGATAGPAPIIIGMHNGFHFSGELFGLRFWNTVRSSTEIIATMDQRVNAATNGLVADYRFTEGTALSVLDSTGHGNDGLLVGAVFPKRVSSLTPLRTADFKIQVEDGKGGADTQSFTVTVAPQLSGNIVGTLFRDANRDSIRQTDETALNGWRVFIDSNGNGYRDPGEKFTTTDVSGVYRFDRLTAGVYPIAVEMRAGFDPVPQAQVEVLSRSTTVWDVAVVPVATGQVRGVVRHDDSGRLLGHFRVFADLNGNGSLELGEPVTMTDSLGAYVLSGLAAGAYSVRVSPPAGWMTTSPNSSAHDVVLADNGLLNDLDFLVAPRDSFSAVSPMIVTHPPSEATVLQPYRYAVAATSPDSRPIRYSLSLAPAGMVIDARTGQIVWTPVGSQSGTQQVIVKAAIDDSSADLQAFRIYVATPNTAPVVTSAPGNPAAVGFTWVYPVVAQDAEQMELFHSLVHSPAGAVIDVDTGVISWTPAAHQVGEQAFEVLVADGEGQSTLHAFTVRVVTDASDSLPFVIRAPRGDGSLLSQYLSRVGGTDASGQLLTAELVAGPVGLTLDASGLIQWSPTPQQLGSQTVSVRLHSPSGASELHEFTIDIRQTARNAAPQITSTPTLFAVVDRRFAYDLSASDADQDALAFELLAAPNGMSLNPASGTLRWLPTIDQLGTVQVSVRVSDPQGGSSVQSFTLTVRRVGGPPLITSLPASEAFVGVSYLHEVVAIDAEADPLFHSLVTAPEGMSIDSRTGLIAWTPTADQVGQHPVIVAVTDGTGGRATQGFSLRVEAGVPNHPPVIMTAPQLYSAVGEAYVYTFVAIDPEGQAVTYALRRGPEGMLVDGVTGLVTWSPNPGQIGRAVVTLTALDPQGGVSVQSFEMDVLGENEPPQIVSLPPSSVPAGAMFRYDVAARDINRDPIRFELIAPVPDGMTIDPLGRIRWATTPADLGAVSVVVRASDPRGGETRQQIDFDVVADTVAPRVTVLPTGGGWPWDRPVTVFVSAVDNVGVVDVELRVNGQLVPLDGNRMAKLLYEDWGPGLFDIVAIARDAAGNEASGLGTAFYRDPEIDYESGEGLPVAAITTPTTDESVSGLVEIRGTAAGTAFKEYRLSYARVGQATFTEFVHSPIPVTEDLLGVWDTTLLENDAYILRLEVVSEVGNTSVAEVLIGLSGELKLGNFRLSFQDMQIPVAGIPITIVRTYDTLRSDRDGDFGFGWRMEYRSTDLRTSLPPTGLEDLGIYTPFKSGTKVYLTLPGGQRQGFTFSPDIRVLPGFGRGNDLVLASPRFTPDRGNTSTLTTRGGQLLVNEQGELHASGGMPWNPASPDFGGGYTLTTADGTSYRIDGNTGLMSGAIDRNGNTLEFSDRGITSSVGEVQVSFERDLQGRITAITDPAGNSTRYTYSRTGDLTAAADRMGNVTRFLYRADRAHYLESVVDPLGRTGLRSTYDARGRLSETTDLLGQAIRISYDPENLLRTVTDEQGRTTIQEYDHRGNVVSSTNALGAATQFTYNDNNHVIRRIDPLGAVTTYTRDALGNPLTVTSPLGHTTRYTFGYGAALSSQTDASGVTTRYELDDKGNLIGVVDHLGNRLVIERDSRGLRSAIRDEFGTVAFSYDQAGRPISRTDDGGVTQTTAYDAVGNVIRQSVLFGGQEFAVATIAYDANGNPTAYTDPSGALFQSTYDSLSQLIETTDPLGRRQGFARAADGEIVGMTYANRDLFSMLENGADGSREIRLANGPAQTYQFDAIGQPTLLTSGNAPAVRFEFDANGRPMAIGTDGDSLRREFDLDGRLVREQSPFGVMTEYVYDPTGRLLEVHRDGTSRSYQYDPLGRLVTLSDSEGGRVEYQYDSRDRVIAIISQDGTVTQYQYDHQDRLTAVFSDDDSVTGYEYDALGQLIAVRDPLGRVTRYEYDPRGQRTAMIRPDGSRTAYAYDSAGRLISSVAPSGREVEFEYDAFDQLIERKNGQEAVQFEFNEAGFRTTSIDSRGGTTFGFDEQGRLVQRIEPDGAFVRYTYADDGRLTSLETKAGRRAYAYDANGYLESVLDIDGILTRYQYDASGQLTRIERGSGTVELLGYDANGLLISQIVQDDQSVTITSLMYQRDGVGRVLSETQLDGTRIEYQYDSTGRLSGEVFTQPGSGPRSIRYVYDRAGNRIRREDSLEGTTIYTYDGADRLVSATLNGVTTTYSYDADGNLLRRFTSAENQTVYFWDQAGRLARVEVITSAGTTVEESRYNAAGLRVARIVNGVETRFLFDTRLPVGEALETYDVDGNVLSSQTLGNGLVAIHTNGVSEIPITDQRGSTRYLLDSSGVLTRQVAYDGFGRIIAGAIGDFPSQFTGEFRSDVSGLDYLRARYRDPETGRFISVDPFDGSLALPATQHDYAYADNDPLNRVDPSGLSTLTEQLTTFFVKNQLLIAGASLQATFSAVGQILTSNVIWGGPTYTVNAPGVSIGFSEFRSEARGGLIEEVNALAVGNSISGSLNLTRLVSKKLKQINAYDTDKFANSLYGPFGQGRANKSQRRQLRAEATQLRKDAAGIDVFGSGLTETLGGSVGSTALGTPGMFGLGEFVFNGFYLNAGISGGVRAGANGLQNYGASAGGSLTVMGFGTGVSVTDTALSGSAGMGVGIEAHLGFSVTVGFSLSIPIRVSPAPNL